MTRRTQCVRDQRGSRWSAGSCSVLWIRKLATACREWWARIQGSQYEEAYTLRSLTSQQ